MTAIEVKYSDGETPSSDNALNTGEIQRLIKAVGRPGDDKRKGVEILPLWECHRLGELLGYRAGRNRYNWKSHELVQLLNDTETWEE